MIELLTLTTTAFVVPSFKLSSLYDSVQAKHPASTETGKHFHRDSAYSTEGILCLEQHDSSPRRK